MVLTKKVRVKVNNRHVKYYKSKGYNVKGGDEIEVNVNDLSEQSHYNIKVKCENCGLEKEIKYYNYISNKKNKNIYLCNNCKQIKIQQTNIEKYGVKTTLLVDDVKNKIKKTCIEKYGVDHYSKTNDFKVNIKKIAFSGVNFKEKSKKTMLKKYGEVHFSKTKLFNDKVKETCLKNYGVEHYSKTDEFKIKMKSKLIEKFKNEYKLNLIDVDDDIYTLRCKEGHIYKSHKWLLKNRRLKYKTNPCTVCNPINSGSEIEKELLKFIKDNYDSEIIENSRKIITPLELDIYLPELKLAFEFNGTFWHNELHKKNNYHLNKTKLCEEKGIQLMHIWEDDWIYKQEIIKSMILNNFYKNRLQIQKIEIKEINDNKLIRNFLNTNHLRGFIGSSIKIGLFYNSELQSLMTFSKSSKNMNYRLRSFCDKLNINIIDSAPKLFNYFIKNYNCDEITAYIKRDHSNGELYEELGFKRLKATQTNYYYIIDGIRQHKFNFCKSELVKEGFNSNKSEHEIMLERKIYRVYDTGNLKFVYKK